MLRRKKFLFAILAIIPTFVIFGWVRMFPIIETLRLSMYDWNLLSKNKTFVGFSNFSQLFRDDQFLDALTNTAIIAFGAMAVTIPVSMALAGVIYHRTRSRFAGFYETAVFIPHVVSLVPAAMAWKWIFDAKLGPLNAIIMSLGGEAQAWLFDPVLSVICIILLVSWQTLGYAVLIYLVGFRNLPKSVYEAARLDGASGIQSFLFMSVPLLKPITLYVSVVTLISGFNVYAQAYVLASDTQGAPGRLVRVLVLDMLENSFQNFRVGYAAAEAVILLSIVLVLTAVQFSLLRQKGGN
ncbi:carbohydrate ABC transporter permease [Primorskyibacter flagellatus]|uniref:Carbohydrate ABC transporter membrane protein 1, CUT1 family n=1 Tax=Primorskyibacter flagellatus TaxID=1387277 RepID=A0A1W2CCQ8_9RHOB|nr:sugar ABC transporter permease [Primorskyibacter flagellatus]SMC82973.1 carbohydrate ABC transporter membrane protein 1, CUT1 family [Primorskyibacter flagellatus]